jgi:hypothetical protein
MLNDQQITKIDAEMKRLEDFIVDAKQRYTSPVLKTALEDTVNGRLDALKWAKENL